MAGWRPMSDHDEGLPSWVMWQQRPFPDANLLLLPGRQPALVDSGFVGHAQETAAWVRAHTGDLALVVTPTGTPTTSAATHCCRPPAPASRPASRTPTPSPAV